MMYEPILGAPRMKRYAINGFKGINLTDTAGESEFSYTEGLVGSYPAVRTRPHKLRLDTVSADVLKIVRVRSEGGTVYFTGLARDNSGVRLYVDNVPVKLEGKASYSLTASDMCVFGSRLIIFPDKVYIDLDEDGAQLHSMVRSVSIKGAVFKSASDEENVITSYISGGDFSAFKRGESVIISGCTNAANNTVRAGEDGAAKDIVSAIVEKIEENKLYLLLYCGDMSDGRFESVTSDCTVSVDIPDMNHICTHANRLWGTSADGTTIYASKLGNPFDFNCFAGISTDSWWGRVATDGEFTAVYPFANHIYAFKKNRIHEVYGDKPSNYKIPYCVRCGCTDGRSICEADGIMYFAAADGVYAYNGGVPKRISSKLGFGAESAVSYALGDKLYFVLGGVMYEYDTQFGDWYRIGESAISCIVTDDDGRMVMAEDGAVVRWGDGGEAVHWCARTQQFMRGSTQKSACVSVWLHISLGENAAATVRTSTDGGEFVTWGVLRGDMSVRRVPVRFKSCNTFALEIEGVGDVKLYGMEFEVHRGGYDVARRYEPGMEE